MFALTLALLLAAPAANPLLAQEPAAKVKTSVYDEEADAASQIADALAIAGKKNQRVLIQWGGNWCGWCIKLAALYKSDQKIAHELLYEYRVLHVDIGHMDKNQDLVKRYGADLTKGVPFLTVLDGQGKVLANQETGALESGDHHDPALVLAFLEKNQAAPQNAADVFAAANAAAKATGKRVLLSFQAPWCGWCHKLEHALEIPLVSKLMDKDFVICWIDRDRMKGGAELELKMNGGKQGLPWFVFLEPDGTPVVDSDDALGANLGCPFNEKEVEAFRGMLMKARKNLSDAEIGQLADAFNEAGERGDEARKAREAEAAAAAAAKP